MERFHVTEEIVDNEATGKTRTLISYLFESIDNVILVMKRVRRNFRLRPLRQPLQTAFGATTFVVNNTALNIAIVVRMTNQLGNINRDGLVSIIAFLT